MRETFSRRLRGRLHVPGLALNPGQPKHLRVIFFLFTLRSCSLLFETYFLKPGQTCLTEIFSRPSKAMKSNLSWRDLWLYPLLKIYPSESQANPCLHEEVVNILTTRQPVSTGSWSRSPGYRANAHRSLFVDGLASQPGLVNGPLTVSVRIYRVSILFQNHLHAEKHEGKISWFSYTANVNRKIVYKNSKSLPGISTKKNIHSMLHSWLLCHSFTT